MRSDARALRAAERGGGGGSGGDERGRERDDDEERVSFEGEMRESYLNYAMSVIVSRALPDARDGLKPVHRRILYSMRENGYVHDKPHRKSARVVGDVIGKYHPHGDQAIYDALARMAQSFSMRAPLIDGQGNFGSIDGDPPAAMRYTEARLERLTAEMMEDLDDEIVDFVPNYDGSEREPSTLPTRFPNLLINGSSGIAVGMSTNIPPHNPAEAIDACLLLLNRPESSLESVMEVLSGPDFPTGGVIAGRGAIRRAYEEGRGSIAVRARSRVEEIRKDRSAIVVEELPYQVNKARLAETVAELVREKRIEGISDIRDESDRRGMRLVFELKRGANPEVTLNQLHRRTAMQSVFGCNLVALSGGRPERLGLLGLLRCFLEFREEVVVRRTKRLLRRSRDRAHVLVGLALAAESIDEVVSLIRSAANPSSARAALMEREWNADAMRELLTLIDDPRHPPSSEGTVRLSEEQAKAILELRLQRLTALGREEIDAEASELADTIRRCIEILGDRDALLGVVRDELVETRELCSSERRTTIGDAIDDLEDEDLIRREPMAVTLSHRGYVKRTALSSYRAQRRGGKGRSAMATRDEDFVERMLVAETHDDLLFFTSRGRVHRMRTWRLPEGSPQSRGRAMANVLPRLDDDERITEILTFPSDESTIGSSFVMFATRLGKVKRHSMSDFSSVHRGGKIAMGLSEGDEIVGVSACREDDDVLIVSSSGKAMRCGVSEVRVVASRMSSGMRGMRLKPSGDDRVTAMFCMSPNEEERLILTLSENGFGVRTSLANYRKTRRGGQGVIAMKTEGRNGPVAAAFPVRDDEQLMLVTDGGTTIRCGVSDVRVTARGASGVRVLRVAEGERIVSATLLDESAIADADALAAAATSEDET